MPTATHGAMIRKQALVHDCVAGELRRIIDDSEIPKKQDVLWPPDQVGHTLWPPPDPTVQQDSFKISPLIDINQSIK